MFSILPRSKWAQTQITAPLQAACKGGTNGSCTPLPSDQLLLSQVSCNLNGIRSGSFTKIIRHNPEV